MSSARETKRALDALDEALAALSEEERAARQARLLHAVAQSPRAHFEGKTAGERLRALLAALPPTPKKTAP
jgi:hypothetical protein